MDYNCENCNNKGCDLCAAEKKFMAIRALLGECSEHTLFKLAPVSTFVQKIREIVEA